MKLFELTEFKLEKPIAIIHDDNESAANMFIMSIARSLGSSPSATYNVRDVPLTEVSRHENLFNLVRADKAGFVWPTPLPYGWELFDPFEEW